MEKHLKFFIEMLKRAEQEIEDVSYGESLLRDGARVGCECGCGGEFLEDEDFEHTRNEEYYREVLNLPQKIKEQVYAFCQYYDIIEEEDRKLIVEVANELKEDIEKYLESRIILNDSYYIEP